MPTPASPEAVLGALRKALPNARLARVPRHPERRDIVLGLVSVRMQRRFPYSEAQLNDLLREAIGDLNGDVDHVTCRRYLVDLGFVKRDRAGMRYFLNYPKVEATLSTDAMASANALIAQALEPVERG